MADIKVKDVIHLYLGCDLKHSFPDKSYEEGIIVLTGSKLSQITDPETQEDKYWTSMKWYKPILRPLSDMTEEEAEEIMRHVLTDPQTGEYIPDDLGLEVIPNDGGNMVDPDCRVVIDFGYSCFSGQLSFHDDGRITLREDDGEVREFGSTAMIITYLLKQQFDLFGLIASNQAIDKTKPLK